MASLMLNKYYSYITDIPSFLEDYLNLGIMQRLKRVSYFCGMDYASKDIYSFPFYVSRFDHSLSCALITWKYSRSKVQTLAALFHDVSTPCFSHVIDYMNEDYLLMESYEGLTSDILKSSKELEILLKRDNIDIDDLINFSKFSIVDNHRPKLCADRLDGIILPSICWSKSINIKDAKKYFDNLALFRNEDNELELGFVSKDIGIEIKRLSDEINTLCNSKEDIYMMMLLAKITKYLLDNSNITYNDLYILDEDELVLYIENFAKEDNNLLKLWNEFKNIKRSDIPNIKLPKVKNKDLNPLVLGKRLF